MSVHWGGRGAAHINRLPRSIGQNPYSGATMLLDFTNPVLDPRITFSRGTNATLVDSTGRITYAPANLLLWSQDFDNAAWTKTAATVTANATTAPDGTMTADALVETTAAGTGHWTFQSITTTAVAHTVSCYIKPNGRDWALIRIRDASSNDRYAWFNIATGTVGTVQTNLVASITGAGNGWFRCVITVSAALAGSNPIVIGAATADNVFSYTGDGTSGLFLWGAQLEPVTYQTTPGPYVATTASAYYGPRFDYDPVTLAPRGLLIEEARTNLLTYSEQFDNAAWGVAGLTVTANTTVAPSGVTAADTITGSSGSNAVIFPAAGFSASATSYTASCYVKAGSAAWIVLSMWQGSGTLGINVWFNAQTGAVGSNNATAGYVFTSASSTAVGNGWYRITVTGTVPVSTVFWSMRIVDGDNAFVYTNTVGDTMFLYGAQLEAGAFATSYIPTVASTVSRSADVATMTGTNFSSWYNSSEGTFVAQYAASFASSGVKVALTAGIGSDNNFSVRLGYNGATISAASASSVALQANFTLPAVSTNYNEVAMAYKTDDFGFSANGSAPATDTSGSVYSSVSMSIGQSGNIYFLNGWITHIAYYNTRLPNTSLQTLTAPSLASPLALDFISPTYTVGY